MPQLWPSGCFFFGRTETSLFWLSWGRRSSVQTLIVVSGLILLIQVGSILIQLAVRRYLDEMEVASKDNAEDIAPKSRGFIDGGKVIGYLERTMIFLFVLAGHPTGIGFLIAAKSILRFGEVTDKNNRMEAEYIIIGTLMSIGYGMLISLATRYLLGLDWQVVG